MQYKAKTNRAIVLCCITAGRQCATCSCMKIPIFKPCIILREYHLSKFYHEVKAMTKENDKRSAVSGDEPPALNNDRAVTLIAATNQSAPLKVAAYCRVSTLMPKQQTSMESQEVHYGMGPNNTKWPGCGYNIEVDGDTYALEDAFANGTYTWKVTKDTDTEVASGSFTVTGNTQYSGEKTSAGGT